MDDGLGMKVTVGEKEVVLDQHHGRGQFSLGGGRLTPCPVLSVGLCQSA